MDFFNPVYRKESPRNDVLFGLVDKEGEEFARSTTSDPRQEWDAVVENAGAAKLQFVPVDKNITIGKEKGEERSMCDGMLYKMDKSWLAFVELKDRTKKAVGDATGQLKSTIDVFLKTKSAKKVGKCYAYVANRRHPDFSRGMAEVKQQFYNACGFHLCCKNTIEVK